MVYNGFFSVSRLERELYIPNAINNVNYHYLLAVFHTSSTYINLMAMLIFMWKSENAARKVDIISFLAFYKSRLYSHVCLSKHLHFSTSSRTWNVDLMLTIFLFLCIKAFFFSSKTMKGCLCLPSSVGWHFLYLLYMRW